MSPTPKPNPYVEAVTEAELTQRIQAAIAGNLTTSAAMLGNVVLWKPASTAMLSGYYLMRLFQEAGLPDGVINLLPGSGRTIGDVALASPELAGIHFTGSTGV